MRYFKKIAEGIDVAPVMAELAAAPRLWDENPLRRVYEGSPHRGMTDIWVRARASTGDSLTSYSEPHESVWWPASKSLPGLRPVVSGVMATVRARRLGGILVTKVPPGGRILPHNDSGHWHAETHRCKVYICLKGNEDCVTWCEDERVVMKTGEAWIFDNLVLHGLSNGGADDRISAIVAMST